MPKYQVTVRRILREDTLLTVEADNPADAESKAQLEAVNVPNDDWEGYDAEYSADPAVSV